MKKKMYTMYFLIFSLCISLTGCSHTQKSEVKQVILGELDQLKNMDLATAKQYISSENLFPDAAQSIQNPELIEEFVSLFFKDFNYKVLDITLHKTNATAAIRVETIDTQALAKDFAVAYLHSEIMAAADSSASVLQQETTMDNHYELMNQLLRENDYGTIEGNCTMELTKQASGWQIVENAELENDIIGGFITCITNPKILTPEETLDIYLSSFKEMNLQQSKNYLGVTSFFADGTAFSESILEALMYQIQKYFDYTIGKSSQDGEHASVNVTVTTFDYASILAQYEQKMNDYLDTPQALYDGEEGRTEISNQFLLDCITQNDATTETTVCIMLVNDSLSWKLQVRNDLLNAIFGNWR